MEPLGVEDPKRVGGFVLRRRLGAGGMGQVYLGWSPGGRAVAVKVVHPHLARQPQFRRRFRQEVTAARKVSGAFTAPVVGAGPEDPLPWIATVYVPGPSLTDAIAKVGPLPVASLWPLAAGLAEALHAIHAEGLLHRDVKPANVLLAGDGPLVIDFGIARGLEGPDLTKTNGLAGTAPFMSPEQGSGGTLGPPSDVFALGSVLAYAATGHEPYGRGPMLRVLERIAKEEPRLDGLSGPFLALVRACQRKSPADRPTPAQLLERIADHWQPPDDVPLSAPWPPSVATLIQERTARHTLRYTSPPDHSDARGRPRRSPAESRSLADIAHDYVQALGADHPESLQARHNHAWALGQDGQHAEAARLLAGVAADRERVLGADHPETLRAHHNHGWNLGQAGEHATAAALLARVAANRERVQGADHPETLYARHSHAWNLGQVGRYAEAAGLLAGVAADRARVLGADHPETLESHDAHAWNLGRAGEHVAAAAVLARLAADRGRVLGGDHPDTLRARYGHAWNLGQVGRHAEAAELLAGVAADRARVLGADHPETLLARRHHAWHLGRLGGRAD